MRRWSVKQHVLSHIKINVLTCAVCGHSIWMVQGAGVAQLKARSSCFLPVAS